MRATRLALCLLLATLLASCDKPAPPPHESSGVRGLCVRGAERRPSGGVRVELEQLDGPARDGVHRFVASTDADGRFRIPVAPGMYVLGVRDPAIPGGKSHAPMTVTVERGKFTEVEVNEDQLDIRADPK